MLSRDWWNKIDLDQAQSRAQTFAGWYFCVPDWQKGATLPDDSMQQRLYPHISRYLGDHAEAAAREVQTIREWFESGERLYHTWKMRKANSYALSNVS